MFVFFVRSDDYLKTHFEIYILPFKRTEKKESGCVCVCYAWSDHVCLPGPYACGYNPFSHLNSPLWTIAQRLMHKHIIITQRPYLLRFHLLLHPDHNNGWDMLLHNNQRQPTSFWRDPTRSQSSKQAAAIIAHSRPHIHHTNVPHIPRAKRRQKAIPARATHSISWTNDGGDADDDHTIGADRRDHLRSVALVMERERAALSARVKRKWLLFIRCWVFFKRRCTVRQWSVFWSGLVVFFFYF